MVVDSDGIVGHHASRRCWKVGAVGGRGFRCRGCVDEDIIVHYGVIVGSKVGIIGQNGVVYVITHHTHIALMLWWRHKQVYIIVVVVYKIAVI